MDSSFGMPVCSSCGESAIAGAKFCGACGKPLRLIDSATAAIKPEISSKVGLVALRNLNKRFAIAVSCGLLLLLILFGSCGSPSVDKYLATVVQQMNSELNQTGCDFGKQIEKSHLTVTYKGGNVTTISAKTVDGSNKAGKNGSNISEITMLITAHWEGKIQSDGFTEVEIVYDNIAKKIKSSRHVKSNALIDLETVDWFKVGYMIGAALATSALN